MRVLPPLLSLHPLLLLPFSLLTQANPLPFALAPRSSPTCANAPKSLAGTIYPRTLTLPGVPDYQGLVWCAPNTAIFIRITFLKTIPVASAFTLQHLLAQTAHAVDAYTNRPGPSSRSRADEVMNMREPAFQMSYEGFTIYPLTSYTNGGGMTWGMLRTAVGVMQDFMTTCEYGTGMVGVWNGARKVGTVVIGGVP